MKHERWIDANGVLVYETGRRSSKKKVLLTKEEFLATKILLSGTVTKILTHKDGTKKSETVFKAPFVKEGDLPLFKDLAHQGPVWL